MGAMPAATATADPPLEPPEMCSRFHGLREGPKAEFSVDDPMANSSQLVFPMTTAPAASSLLITVASYGGTNVSSIREAAVVAIPRVMMLSFTATGTPASGAERLSRSTSRARSRARSPAIVRNAFSVGSTVAIRAIVCSQISTADTCRAATASRISRAVWKGSVLMPPGGFSR
jgi:hypothetical protein